MIPPLPQGLTPLKRSNTLRFMRSPARWLCPLLLLVALPLLARDYRFDGSMSEEVLRNYLSRSMTTMYLLTGHGDFDDNLRMLTNCGVKFAGRAVYQIPGSQGFASEAWGPSDARRG